MTFLEYVEHFDKALAERLKPAFTTRGVNKGMILKNAPNSRQKPVANAVWNAVMAEIAGARVQMCNLMFMQGEAEKEFNELSYILADWKFSLNVLAQRPYQFNLFALRYDIEKCKNLLKETIDTGKHL